MVIFHSYVKLPEGRTMFLLSTLSRLKLHLPWIQDVRGHRGIFALQAAGNDDQIGWQCIDWINLVGVERPQFAPHVQLGVVQLGTVYVAVCHRSC